MRTRKELFEADGTARFIHSFRKLFAQQTSIVCLICLRQRSKCLKARMCSAYLKPLNKAMKAVRERQGGEKTVRE